MKTSKGFWLPGLLLAVLLLASCGGASGGGGAGGEGNGGMKDMDHGSMDGGKQGGGEGMKGMDHGSMGGEKMARQMVSPNGKYSDKAFIDAMVPHHEGAVEMAEVALKNADHGEIKELSRNIIAAQEAEINELGKIRKQEFGSAQSPSGMSEMDMQMMGMTDPQKLAKQKPFDKAFIDAMIPHHESAIAMASVALEESKDEEIRSMSRDIVKAQKREISQMRSWRQQWYPEG